MQAAWRWRVEGLHRTYRSTKPCRLNRHHDTTITALRDFEILQKKILHSPVDSDND